MRLIFESSLARVRRARPAAQDAVACVVLCLVVVALIMGTPPPRFLLDPLVGLADAAPYRTEIPSALVGSPELDDAPAVEVARSRSGDDLVDQAAATADPERQPQPGGDSGTLAAAEESDSDSEPKSSGGSEPTDSPPPPPPPPPASPAGLCDGNSSPSGTKHADESGLDNGGSGHGCTS